MLNKEQMKGIKAKSPQEIVRQLADYSMQCEPEAALPGVTVYLGNGSSFSGQIVALKTDDRTRQETVFLQDLAADSVSFLALDNIVAVMLHNASSCAYILTGARPPVQQGEAITRLELKRVFETLSAGLKQKGVALRLEADWTSMPAGDDVNVLLRSCMNTVVAAVEAIAVDEPGRAAWTAWGGISLAHAEVDAAELTADQRKITLKLNMNKALASGFQDLLVKHFNNIL